MTDFSPREIVSELDRHIIGQKDAKRAVAIALRNRWRRKQLDDVLRDEVFSATAGKGARRDGSPIQPSAAANLA